MSQPQPLTFSTDDYTAPQWSSLPTHPYHLQIIKDGTIIGNLNLKQKQFILVGRNSELCDLFIDNPSISRKHAILQFKAGKQGTEMYVYDLGSAHGTEVNWKKLPARAYQRVKAFEMIKFGKSSRYYVVRCPQLEGQERVEAGNQEDQRESRFEQLIAENHKLLSKKQMKEKYIAMLQNDQYNYKAAFNNAGSKFQGNQPTSNSFSGVDWGISDQLQVYRYHNQNQYQLEPDTIRRLPGLTTLQLDKLSEYQTCLHAYQQIQQQLNSLASRQRRQFGLEDKLRDKKQRLEKRFVEAVEQLEKVEEWIRAEMFGDKSENGKAKGKGRGKIEDSFGDDQFLDRTLIGKSNDKSRTLQDGDQGKQEDNKQDQDIFTTTDFWKLQKQLRGQVKLLIALQKQQNQLSYNSEDRANEQPQQQQQQQDNLDKFMNQNNTNLQKQQKTLTTQRIQQQTQKIQKIRNYLIPLIGVAEVDRIERDERGIKGSGRGGDVQGEDSEQERRIRKEQESRKRIGDVLDQLDVIREAEEEDGEGEEDDARVFDRYRNHIAEYSDSQQQQDQHQNRPPKRGRPSQLDNQQQQYNKINKKTAETPTNNNRSRAGVGQHQNWGRDQKEQEEDEGYIDLTSLK